MLSQEELRDLVRTQSGVEPWVASEADGAPEIAWGDTFFYAATVEEEPRDRVQPYAAIVTKDYPGFDEASELDRPGVYRLNVWAGREAASALDLGDDPAALDVWLAHPVYGRQGWVCILNPSRLADVEPVLAAALERARR